MEKLIKLKMATHLIFHLRQSQKCQEITGKLAKTLFFTTQVQELKSMMEVIEKVQVLKMSHISLEEMSLNKVLSNSSCINLIRTLTTIRLNQAKECKMQRKK